jgi:hypothetical protein
MLCSRLETIAPLLRVCGGGDINASAFLSGFVIAGEDDEEVVVRRNLMVLSGVPEGSNVSLSVPGGTGKMFFRLVDTSTDRSKKLYAIVRDWLFDPKTRFLNDHLFAVLRCACNDDPFSSTNAEAAASASGKRKRGDDDGDGDEPAPKRVCAEP